MFNPFARSRKRQTVMIVSGLPRSGTSMMMKMLEAGGVPPMTDNLRQADEDNPKGYYEYEPVKKLAESPDKSWVGQTSGRVTKVISQLLKELPREFHYKVVFMQRHLDEVLASQERMLQRQGKSDGADRAKLRQLFAKHLDGTIDWLGRQPNFEVLYIDYGQVLREPARQAARVAAFLAVEAEPGKMAEVVDPELYRNRA